MSAAEEAPAAGRGVGGALRVRTSPACGREAREAGREGGGGGHGGRAVRGASKREPAAGGEEGAGGRAPVARAEARAEAVGGEGAGRRARWRARRRAPRRKRTSSCMSEPLSSVARCLLASLAMVGSSTRRIGEKVMSVVRRGGRKSRHLVYVGFPIAGI